MRYDLYKKAAETTLKQIGIDLDRPVPATEEYMRKRKMDISKVKGIPYNEEEEQSVVDHINSRIDFILDRREAEIFNTMDPKTRGLSNQDIKDIRTRNTKAEQEAEDMLDRIEKGAEREKEHPTVKDFPTWALHYPNFIRASTNKLKTGHIEYGDKSWSKDPLALIQEMKEELVDQSNWAMISWVRLCTLESEIRTTLGGLHSELGDILGRYTKERSTGEQGQGEEVRSSDSGQTSAVEVDRVQRDTKGD